MSQYPYPPGPAAGSAAGTGLSDDALSVTEPGADGAYATSTRPTTSSTASPPSSSSTTDVAKDEASGVRDTATQAGQHVAGTAKEQAGEVMSEAKDQARSLLDRTRGEMTDQASTQQQRAAESLHALSGELTSMARSQQQPGVATDLARQAADKAGQLASWLESREPGDVLHEVTTFARRRPGMFLALAAGAGVVAGRLTRGMTAGPPFPGSSSARHLSGSGYRTGTSSTRPFTRTSTGTSTGTATATGTGTGAAGAPDADLAPPMTSSPGLGEAGMPARDTGSYGNGVTS
ncbi:MAG TPA: hypothetical protein VFL94_02865 [Actinomycetales bacterium]|nr:hypothetical protein [Actinomycetales bacterium]